MNPVPSRLLQRLDAAIAASHNVVEADCLRAEQALYHVRQGHFEMANTLLVDVRQRHERRPLAVTSVWLSLVDGLAAYFTDISSPVARDKLRRAYAMSEAAGLVNLHALCAAWMAQLDFGEYQVESMAFNIHRALTLSATHDHRVRSRACLTTAQAFQAAADEVQSKKWYAKAHIHCTSQGDSLMISAMMHNIAWLSYGNIRQAVLMGGQEVDQKNLSLTGSESVNNIDNLIGVVSLNSLIPMLRAQMLVLRDDPSAATQIFEKYFEESKRQGLSRLQGTFLSDLAWCRAKQHQYTAAINTAMEAESILQRQAHHVDDLAATHSRLQLVYELLQEPVKAEYHARLATQYWEEFSAFQAKIIELLAPIEQLADA